MRKKILILVETNFTTGRLLIAKTRQLGFHPIVLTTNAELYPYLVLDDVETRTVGSRSIEELRHQIDLIAADGDICGIASTTCWGVYEAAALARDLGLPGQNPETVKLCRDKGALRQVLNGFGLDDIKQAVCTSIEDCVHAAEAIGYPVVIKPVSGAGSIGAFFCSDAVATREHANFLTAISLDWRTRPEFVVEEAIEGPQFSIEIFNGKIIGIVRQHYGALPHFVCTGHDFPAIVEPDIKDALITFGESLISKLSLSWGSMHVEVRFDSKRRGVRLIEINSRLCGAFVPELIRYASGVDLIELNVKNHLGLPVAVDELSSDSGVLRFFLVPDKTVNFQGVDLRSAAKDAQNKDIQIYVKPGAVLLRNNDFRDRFGHVISVSAKHSEALSSADLVLQEVIGAL